MPAYPGGRSDEIAASLETLPAGTPVSEVARRMLDLFTGGSIAPGTRLPPERQLAMTLGVGRSAVREALAALEIIGIVDVRPGSGTYLRGTASELLPQTLRWGLLIGEQSTADLLELRSGLEIYVARLAAARAAALADRAESGVADAEALAEASGAGGAFPALATTLDGMRSTVGDLAAFARADLDFHHALAEAAGNAVLIDMLHVVRSLLQVYADRAVHDAGQAQAAIDEHDAVYRAVVAGDENGAASAMAAHMATASHRLSAEASRQ